MQTSLDRPLLDIAAVAAYLGVHEDSVRRMIDRGLLPIVQFGGKGQTIRIRPESLDRVLRGWETRHR